MAAETTPNVPEKPKAELTAEQIRHNKSVENELRNNPEKEVANVESSAPDVRAKVDEEMAKEAHRLAVVSGLGWPGKLMPDVGQQNRDALARKDAAEKKLIGADASAGAVNAFRMAYVDKFIPKISILLDKPEIKTLKLKDKWETIHQEMMKEEKYAALYGAKPDMLASVQPATQADTGLNYTPGVQASFQPAEVAKPETLASFTPPASFQPAEPERVAQADTGPNFTPGVQASFQPAAPSPEAFASVQPPVAPSESQPGQPNSSGLEGAVTAIDPRK